MAVKIQVKRGSKAGLPTLSAGEFGVALDTKEVFVGGQSGNMQLPVLETDGKIKKTQIPDLDYDAAGSAQTIQENLDEHISDKDNPHGVTPSQIGAAASSHNHSASNITSGTLSTARGGTGQTTLTPAVTTKGVRQIYAGTSDMTAGSSSLTTGVIYLVYE